MKKLGLLLIVFMIVGGFSSCMKDGDSFDPTLQYEIEKELIEEYVMQHLPNATFNEHWGVWYELVSIGNREEYEYKVVDNRLEYPTVNVKYTGKLLNGTVFDEQNDDDGIEFYLGGNIIQAWPLAFFPQKIDDNEVGGLTPSGLYPGAVIRFVTPSYLAYANHQQGNIPPNSPLDFTIEVLDVSAPTSSSN